MSQQPKQFGPVVNAARAFCQSLRDNPPPAGRSVLASAPAKEEARSLMAAAGDWHRQWEAERNASGRGFRVPDGPLPPPQTPHGRLVRAAKAYGHSQRPGATEAEYSGALLELLNASQALPRSDSRKPARTKKQQSRR